MNGSATTTLTRTPTQEDTGLEHIGDGFSDIYTLSFAGLPQKGQGTFNSRKKYESDKGLCDFSPL